MCLALSIAYWLDLDEPYWAMTSAAVVSFPTVGGVISKSFGRIAGSLLGACAALLLAGHTLNDPWLFLFSISAWIALCTWACAMYTNNVAYAFQLAGYTCAIIAFPVINITDANELWSIAQSRVCEVIVGILCGGLMMMIMPSTSDGTALLTALKNMHARLLEHASLLWVPETTDAHSYRPRKRDRANPDHEPAANSGLLESLPFSPSESAAELFTPPAAAADQRNLQPAPDVSELAGRAGADPRSAGNAAYRAG